MEQALLRELELAVRAMRLAIEVSIGFNMYQRFRGRFESWLFGRGSCMTRKASPGDDEARYGTFPKLSAKSLAKGEEIVDNLSSSVLICGSYC